MLIPPYLEEQIRAGRAVLILGAGASLGAVDAKGNSAPKTDQLKDLIADKFLGGKLKNRSLSQVAEYAISESNILEVQEFIRQRFDSLQPTDAHKLLPEFKWWGIATTNYDRLIETAYAVASDPAQELVSFVENGDRIDEHLRSPVNLILLKLHGCITRTANPRCPLILTVDQYIDHRAGRSRLFDQLMDWGYEHVFVFIGHSLQDPDIRQLIKDLTNNATARARFFCVAPDADPIEQRSLEQQRITVLSASFDDFMKALDVQIPSPFRRVTVSAPKSTLPIALRFANKASVPSKALIQFLTIDTDYVNTLVATDTVSPADFYKGFNPGFSAVEQALDLRRKIGDEILTDVFLAGETEHADRAELVLIKAHAGAGKTVLLRRLAWDAAHDYNCLCLFMRPGGIISTPAIQELIELCPERIYLFADDAADRVRELESLLQHIGPSGRRLTIVTGERINEWNVSCQSLDGRVTDMYVLRYLTSPEIDDLLHLLELHKAEGYLHGRTTAEKRTAFEERAGRQLLVALHEATLGVPFQEIIQNEFDNIWPLEAKQIYLTICVLNRLNVPVRAGIVSRIHGVPFEDFKRRLFQPLEHIVQAEYDNTTRDYVYRARHPHIAQMVFDTVLVKQEDRFDSFIRCLGALNIDYSTDRIAFRQMTRAKAVLELFPDHAMATSIYAKAQERTGTEDGTLIHQIALYELHRPNGSLERSSTLLSKAAELRPFDVSIKHSQAELHVRLSEVARTGLEKDKHLREATLLCRDYNNRATADTYGYTTLAKIGLNRLSDALDSGDALGIEQAVKDVESALQDGFQRFPGDPYLREAEARLAECLEDSDRALHALEKALQTNPRSGFIANRLARLHRKKGEDEEAKRVLETALAANNSDRRLHFAYAWLLMDTGGEKDTILYHLQRSFTPGDSNYEAQLLFGRQLYVDGKLDEARKVFRALKAAPTSLDVKFALHYPLTEEFRGEIVRAETTYCFIARDGQGDWIYAYRDNVGLLWTSLSVRKRVIFRIAFAFGGPTAFSVRIEN
jgi:tetratricopeptide (TPR) repeat protein